MTRGDEDPEKLLARALRAQAARAPSSEPPPNPTAMTVPTGPTMPPHSAVADSEQEPTGQPEPDSGNQPEYGDDLPLLLGQDTGPTGRTNIEPRLRTQRPGSGTELRGQTGTSETQPVRTSWLAAGWVLALAMLLGLAAGTVAGLITLF